MNIEQVEGQLAEYGGHFVSVSIPIRNTVQQTFYGKLDIKTDFVEEHIILYIIHFYPDADITFQAQDVHKIVPTENCIDSGTEANIILKGDTWMEQLNAEH